MIGKLHRLPFIGELFYGKKINGEKSRRLAIVYHNVQPSLLLMYEDVALPLETLSEQKLKQTIQEIGINPDTCYFTPLNNDYEPQFITEEKQADMTAFRDVEHGKKFFACFDDGMDPTVHLKLYEETEDGWNAVELSSGKLARFADFENVQIH